MDQLSVIQRNESNLDADQGTQMSSQEQNFVHVNDQWSRKYKR